MCACDFMYMEEGKLCVPPSVCVTLHCDTTCAAIYVSQCKGMLGAS